MSKYLCVLDFEATCWNTKNPDLDKQEIIEFPSALYELNENKQLTYIGEFSKYVKPTIHPILSDFCTELTGITQEQVDSAEIIEKVYEAHHQWLISNAKPKSDIYIITCGAWDLKTMLPKEIKNKKLRYYPEYKKYINIKDEFKYFYKKKKQPRGMVEMLDELELKLDGRHHSGIDDTRNIAKILVRMVNESHTNFKINDV